MMIQKMGRPLGHTPSIESQPIIKKGIVKPFIFGKQSNGHDNSENQIDSQYSKEAKTSLKNTISTNNKQSTHLPSSNKNLITHLYKAKDGYYHPCIALKSYKKQTTIQLPKCGTIIKKVNNEKLIDFNKLLMNDKYDSRNKLYLHRKIKKRSTKKQKRKRLSRKDKLKKILRNIIPFQSYVQKQKQHQYVKRKINKKQYNEENLKHFKFHKETPEKLRNEIINIVKDLYDRKGLYVANEMKQILLEYQNYIGKEKFDIGRIDGVTYKIHMKPGVEPIKDKISNLPPLQEQEIKRTIDVLLKYKLIEPYEGP